MIHLMTVFAAIPGRAAYPAGHGVDAPVRCRRPAPDDTVRRRPKAVEVSDWYGRRLTIHRTLSYVTIPVFAAQYVAGERLFKEGTAAPSLGQKPDIALGATALAGILPSIR